MKRRIVVVGMVILLLVLAGCGLTREPTPTPDVEQEYVQVISVTGKLLPETWATLSHDTGGRVTEVRVKAGDRVGADMVLVRLDTLALEISLEAARREVAAQQAALDRLLEGASAQSIARADRENAQQIAQAEVALRIAEEELVQARARDPKADVAAARARIRGLEAQLAQLRAQDPVAQVTLAQVELERAKIALDDAQNEYNKALDRPWEDQKIRDAWAKQLEQAQLNYEAAEAAVEAAQAARRAHALSLPTLEAQLEEARVLEAQAVEAQQAYSSTLRILEHKVEAARLQVQYLRAWDNPLRDPPSRNDVAQTRARLAQAEWNVRQIERQIQETTVRAPFAGVVGAVSVRAGEIVAPGQPLVTVGDLGTLRVETTDLDEIDVVHISPEQAVVVTFDALPDRVFPGRVTRISPMAQPGTGGVHYTVEIELEEVDPALRWGMTAFVDIELER